MDSDSLSSNVIRFTLNGREVSLEAEPGMTLLEALRERFGLTSPKNGCAPQGQCGCCAVLIDGRARLSCALPVAKVAGRSVVTLEGVAPGDRAWVAECFARAGAAQCGFCIPGMAVRALDLLASNPDPTREEIARALRPHLCRCTGYVKILDAIELMARVRRGEPLPPEDAGSGVGARRDRWRAKEFVLGDWRYVEDLQIPGMLHAAPRLSDHPRARLLAIDPAPAKALPGVVAVFTAADVPGERYVGLIERDWPVFVAIGEETRCVGDMIALVVADSPRHAREAAAALRVDYEPLPPLTSPEEALAPGAPAIHPKGNLLSRTVIRRGDVEAAFRGATHILEGEYITQRIEHLFMEPEACVAVSAPGADGSPGLQVYSQGQGVFDDRRQIAQILGWPIERVRVDLVSNGGGFGGKEDMSVQGQTALAAARLGRPVKCALTREESLRVHPKRHPMTLRMKIAADGEGRLLGLWARITGDTGAYASVGAKVIERAVGHAGGPYRIPAADVEGLAVYTNNPPCGAMRGFGVNQAAFAMESLLNRLARAVGVDAWEIRWRNILRPGDRLITGQRMSKPFGLEKTLLAVRDAFRAGRFAGIACGIKNTGIGNGYPDTGKASIRIEAPDRIVIRTGFTEMGQGLFTVCLQVACEETGLPPALFHVTTDTSVDLDCGQTTASRGTTLASAAVRDAARKLRAELDRGATPRDLAGREFRGEFICDDTTALEEDVPEPKTHLTYGFATQVAILDERGRVRKVIAAHDVGRAINPKLLEGQIEGSVHMGLGYALTEELPTEAGRLKSLKVRDLGVIRAPHMPEVEVILVEEPDLETAYGVRGVGEIGLVPTAPAVAGALEAFDGVHRTRLPMKDSPAARAILNPAAGRENS